MNVSIKRLAIALSFPPFAVAILLSLVTAVMDGSHRMGLVSAVHVFVAFALYGAIFCLPVTLGLWITTEIIERRGRSPKWHAATCVAFGVLAGGALELVISGSAPHLLGLWLLVGAVVGFATSTLLRTVQSKA